jgi:L-alanine-DL-glutamate epimerase-like enolase superfamily enzyme
LKLAAGACLSRHEALAAPYRNKVKVGDIQEMALRTQTGNCLIRIITDEGLVGYGEAGAARARIDLLVGKDPLAIEKHFQNRGC